MIYCALLKYSDGQCVPPIHMIEKAHCSATPPMNRVGDFHRTWLKQQVKRSLATSRLSDLKPSAHSA